MTKNHLKARSAPRTWNIPRKTTTFVARPNPGSQSIDMTLPLGVFMKTIGVGTTKKEINFVIKQSPVLVNGVRRWDYNFGVGFQDVVAIADHKIFQVLTLDSQGRLTPQVITAEQANQKLAQVRTITAIAGGKLQLALTDGRTMLLATKKDTKKEGLVRGSTVVVAVPKGTIVSTHPVAPKAHVILVSGKHRGSRGTIESIEGEFVTVKTPEGSISTKKNYAFVTAGGMQ